MKHGRPTYLHEIANHPTGLAGESVRIVGRLDSYDPVSRLAVLEREGHRAAIDTEYVDPFAGKVGDLLMAIGELEPWQAERTMPSSLNFSPRSTLKARIVRIVNGMDVGMMEEAVRILRRHQEERLDALEADSDTAMQA